VIRKHIMDDALGVQRHTAVLTSGASAWPGIAEMGSLMQIPRPCGRTTMSNITYSLSNITYRLEKQQHAAIGRSIG
jgi:hypothetical protein